MIKQFDDTDIQELKDIIRIGIVSKVDASNMTARVKIEEQEIITGDLQIVQNIPTVEIEVESESYQSEGNFIVKPWIPKVGQWVLCIFRPDGEGDGFILGGI